MAWTSEMCSGANRRMILLQTALAVRDAIWKSYHIVHGREREFSVGAASAAGVTGASECESGGLRLVVWARPGRTHCDQAANNRIFLKLRLQFFLEEPSGNQVVFVIWLKYWVRTKVTLRLMTGLRRWDWSSGRCSGNVYYSVVPVNIFVGLSICI